jgi:hypothetical protein
MFLRRLSEVSDLTGRPRTPLATAGLRVTGRVYAQPMRGYGWYRHCEVTGPSPTGASKVMVAFCRNALEWGESRLAEWEEGVAVPEVLQRLAETKPSAARAADAATVEAAGVSRAPASPRSTSGVAAAAPQAEKPCRTPATLPSSERLLLPTRRDRIAPSGLSSENCCFLLGVVRRI